MKVLIVDNNDSFTYNLVQIVEESGISNFQVKMHDAIEISEVEEYDKILISPGAALPKDYPIIGKILKSYASTKSILGVCLGLQAIVEYFGGGLMHLDCVVHGQKRTITILKKDVLFNGITDTTNVGLYHSWAASDIDFPPTLEITSRSEFGTIMSVRHKEFDVRGVQFHPESHITTHGFQILYNWLLHPKQELNAVTFKFNFEEN
ncbi:MAG: aminodeoxychorismate/anthranilate synthase component II [Bacteroidetes bacterium]|nr:aminodeoxychorismate/anthranilate synthase component II [Bacteroidota bacterium]